MTCELCISVCDKLADTTFNKGYDFLKLFKDHGLKCNRKFCNLHYGMNCISKCNNCTFNFPQFMDEEYVTHAHESGTGQNVPSEFLRFIYLFLQDSFSEKIALENNRISKATFDRWLLLCLSACDRWMKTQGKIGGSDIDVVIDNGSVSVKEENGKTSVITVFKAFSKVTLYNGEHIIAIKSADSSLETLISRMHQFVDPYSNIFFFEKDNCSIEKVSLHFKKPYDLSTNKVIREPIVKNKHSRLQLMNTQFWNDLKSRISSSEERKECPHEHFARYLLLMKYSSRKELALHHFLLNLAKMPSRILY